MEFVRDLFLIVALRLISESSPFFPFLTVWRALQPPPLRVAVSSLRAAHLWPFTGLSDRTHGPSLSFRLRSLSEPS